MMSIRVIIEYSYDNSIYFFIIVVMRLQHKIFIDFSKRITFMDVCNNIIAGKYDNIDEWFADI